MIHVGDYVTRNSYQNDTVFEVISVQGDYLLLKGVYTRILADASMSDCVLVSEDMVRDEFDPDDSSLEVDRNEFFYLPGKILHLDGDSSYLKRCMSYYKKNHVMAVGRKIDETKIPFEIGKILDEVKPDIVVITGHDAYLKNKGDKDNLNHYKNSKYFVKAVLNARQYEKSHEKLIIIAGACQSDYEELIKAGANFASSPKRVNIHALDPAIIATSLALTERSKEVPLIELLSRTRNGSDGMGGLISNGMMYVGYPR